MIRSNDASLSAEELERLRLGMEADYDAVASFLGASRLPSAPIEVVFEGDMFVAGQRRIPHVDALGRVHLYRSPGPKGSYLGSFPHELVHALRAIIPDRMRLLAQHGARFLEEGFAEAVALEAGRSIDIYPYFGTEPDAVVAYLLDTGRDVPLRSLLERHRELNLSCEMQSYPLRASFMRYVARKVGQERFIELAYSRGPFGARMYEEATGLAFDELVSAWRDDALARAGARAVELGRAWETTFTGFGLRLCDAR